MSAKLSAAGIAVQKVPSTSKGTANASDRRHGGTPASHVATLGNLQANEVLTAVMNGTKNVTDERTPTGVPRLDELLGRGLPTGGSYILQGPSYTGKRAFANQFAIAAPKAGEPVIIVTTDASAYDVSRELREIDPRVPEWEQDHLLSFVDLYSQSVGIDSDHPAAYLKGADDLGELSAVLEKALGTMEKRAPSVHPRIIIDSLSTLLMGAGVSRVFPFLRSLTGRARREGATLMLTLQAGMHSDPEVQAVRHVCSGVLETRVADDRFYLHVEGIRTAYQTGWVEYELNRRGVEITGSFASGRIRGATTHG